MFGTSGIRGPVGEEVTADLALSVGRAVASEGATRIVVGRDPRVSGRLLADAAMAGAEECGADVIDLGMVATPTLARSVGWLDADAGIMVTASHNPTPDNGLKLWNPSGQAFDTDQREAISRRIESGDYELKRWDGIGSKSTQSDATDRHVEALVETIRRGADDGRAGDEDADDGSTDERVVNDRDADDGGEDGGNDEPLSGLTVVVDVGNGAGGLTADALAALGAHVLTLNAQPDGRFPGRPSEPTRENCRALCEFVAETDADLGIAHDGDADRMRAVTESGQFVQGDVQLALFARAVVSEGQRVAAPVNISLAVDDELEARGASLTRTRVGDVFVAERATEPDVVFGGESSGAWIWPDETLCPDGPLAACKLVALVAAAGSLDGLVSEIASYPLRRRSVELDDKYGAMARIEEAAVAEYADDRLTTTDGVHVAFDDGWFLVRASGTQPLIRLTAEARDEARTEELLDQAAGLIDGVR
ncbi:phosphopentomutase/phosphoglucosamine mutase [Halegenticoccus soli]|uniref:phosphopentomutase/phosphoglucosamine mutase n=1 Tax=Halegenticoccus soli TaxID=1985678 RepID=UPI000C6DCAE9|nr:phosphopentomutase/phosphoglucosamine mutase [Halegenticoccus soli]